MKWTFIFFFHHGLTTYRSRDDFRLGIDLPRHHHHRHHNTCPSILESYASFRRTSIYVHVPHPILPPHKHHPCTAHEPSRYHVKITPNMSTRHLTHAIATVPLLAQHTPTYLPTYLPFPRYQRNLSVLTLFTNLPQPSRPARAPLYPRRRRPRNATLTNIHRYSGSSCGACNFRHVTLDGRLSVQG